MCGLVAISSVSGQSFSLDKPLQAIRHRGPDDSGAFASQAGDCHLGHVRLSILDLSTAGRQPMTDTSGRFVISYNGEVYNFATLRSGLEQRHGPIAWRSGTDTEVIVEGFAREGRRFLGRLNGIFALAIYDADKRLMHVLRDPLGIKPLFVTEQSAGAFFCSELKGLLALPSLSRTLRLESFADQLAFMYVPEPHTLYNEFRKLEPGICFSFREGQRVGAQALFAHLRDPLNSSSEREATERLRAILAAAVERQLVADVPVSLFLSGGLDSSAIAAQASRAGANIKDAYTISFSREDRRRDAQSDDLRYASLMATQLGLNLRVIPATANFIELLPKLITFMEDGFSDPAAINTYLICAAARDAGVKVMLSGQGADEYLGGYRRYPAEKYLSRLPPTLFSTLAVLSRLASRAMAEHYNGASRRLARFASLTKLPRETRLLGMYTWTAPAIMRDLLLDPKPWRGGAEFKASFDSFANDHILDAMMKVDQHYDLMSLNLCYTDRMSMAAGVEVRVPFLDFDLVRLMNSIPHRLKVKGSEGKYLLKKALEPLLPREIIYREKAGFGLPIRAWLRNHNDFVNTYLSEARIERQGIFRSSAVRRILDEERRGIADHANTLFTLLCQQIWLEAYPGLT
jgi:asparagine synthase (glutamine-hydrolysing)